MVDDKKTDPRKIQRPTSENPRRFSPSQNERLPVHHSVAAWPARHPGAAGPQDLAARWKRPWGGSIVRYPVKWMVKIWMMTGFSMTSETEKNDG